MMKILLLIFSLYLISGPVAHSNVIGYSGGGVILSSDLKWDYSNHKYICKTGQTACVDIIRSNTKSAIVQKHRFMLFRNSYGYLRVLIKKLQPQDAGRYRIGLSLQWYFDVDLEVLKDSCFGKTQQIKAYAGENIILTCNYPEHFEENIKDFAKLGDNSVIENIVNTENMYQRGKFSISDDRRNKRIYVSISDVRGEDEGVYLCAVFISTRQYAYYFFTEIELQVTGTSSVTSTGPTETSSDAAHFSYAVIVIVCICVSLLLIGGFVLILYFSRCRQTQGSASLGWRRNDNNQAAAHYENDSANLHLYENHNIRMTSVHQNLHLDSLHQSLDPSTNQSDSVYHSLDPTTNQLESTSQNPDSSTNQSNSVYQCLNRKTQSNSIYHTLQS